MSLSSLLLLLILEVGFQRVMIKKKKTKKLSCTPSLILSGADMVLAAAEIIPSICVAHASASCAGALSPLSFPSWVPGHPFQQASRWWLFPLAAGPLGICFSKGG